MDRVGLGLRKRRGWKILRRGKEKEGRADQMATFDLRLPRKGDDIGGEEG